MMRDAEMPVPIRRRPVPADLFALARRRYLQGRFENIELLAAELGISRATAYKWGGNSEKLLARIIAALTEERFRNVNQMVDDTGALRVLRILMQLSRVVADEAGQRRIAERNPEKFLRMVTSKDSPVQQTITGMVQAVLEAEQKRGQLSLPYDAHTMAFILVRVCESFLYADLIDGVTIDFGKEETTLRILLGLEKRQQAPAEISRRLERV